MSADLTILEYMSSGAPELSEDELKDILQTLKRFPNWEFHPRTSAVAASLSSARDQDRLSTVLWPRKDEQRALAAGVAQSL